MSFSGPGCASIEVDAQPRRVGCEAVEIFGTIDAFQRFDIRKGEPPAPFALERTSDHRGAAGGAAREYFGIDECRDLIRQPNSHQLAHADMVPSRLPRHPPPAGRTRRGEAVEFEHPEFGAHGIE
jgi:hypothetical protein